MKPAPPLRNLSVQALAQLAKKRGVRGFQNMRKDQLLAALGAGAKGKSPQNKSGLKVKSPVSRTQIQSRLTAASNHVAPRAQGKPAVASKASAVAAVARPSTVKLAPQAKPAPPKPALRAPAEIKAKPALPKSPAVTRRLEQARQRGELAKNLAYRHRSDVPGGSGRDRLVVLVRDPFWLHAHWELTRASVTRAEAALGQDWHLSRPVLRLLDVSSRGTTSSAERVIRHIDIHGGVTNWYIDVQDPPRSYRVEIGYLTIEGRFHMLARSNVVTTPAAGASDELDENWTDVAENFEKIYAMSGGYAPEGPPRELQQLFEERLRRPMGTPVIGRFGPGAEALFGVRQRGFNFTLDAELLVYGQTEAGSHVTLQGDPVQLRDDGTFTVRFALPNCRQVIPAVSSSADGLEQRTIVLAVERNTKVMEPVTRDNAD